MKKTLLILVAIVFAVTACDKQTYVDGDYSATFDELDSHGWNAFVEFTLTEDVISNVNFDYVNADGVLKSTDSAYNARMLSIAGTNPATYVPLIESAITNTTIVPEYEAIDAVTGATGSSENANLLMEAALEAAIDGEPKDVVLPQVVEEE
jgi:major membrane immunogen (membrane-anchored lipoprotein)